MLERRLANGFTAEDIEKSTMVMSGNSAKKQIGREAEIEVEADLGEKSEEDENSTISTISLPTYGI